VWRIPEGLRVLADGSWQVGGLPVVHDETLRYLKQHVVFEDASVFVVDGRQRVGVAVEGPLFVVTSLVLDQRGSEARAVLDDGSSETVGDGAVGMNEDTGRFECLVRGGRARALFSRAAHQSLLESVEERDGRFFLRVGDRRLSIRA
jgi:hypothetical protein